MLRALKEAAQGCRIMLEEFAKYRAISPTAQELKFVLESLRTNNEAMCGALGKAIRERDFAWLERDQVRLAYVREHSPKPPKLSARKELYREWLRISDVFPDLTFGEWIKKCKEARAAFLAPVEVPCGYDF